MNSEDPNRQGDQPSESSASASFMRKVGPHCEKFEKAWSSGERPDIQKCLDGFEGAERSYLLFHLLRIELECRHGLEAAPTADEYLQRFPNDARLIRRIFRHHDNVTAEPAAELPQQIDKYRVEKVLGQGGFGVVYLAYDTDLNRYVAIKVPHRRIVSEFQDAEIYRNEARAVASLDHPNIAPAHHSGSTDHFPYFFVSKFVEGSDLAARAYNAPFSYEAAAELVATIAEALHYAHTKQLVHRNVKPSNILVDSEGTPYLVDFGLALHDQKAGTVLGFAGDTRPLEPGTRHVLRSWMLEAIFSAWVSFSTNCSLVTDRSRGTWKDFSSRSRTPSHQIRPGKSITESRRN